MSTALFFLVPIGTLAIAWSLCFVGCVLNTHGQGNTTYSENSVLTETSLVAYWPLSDLIGPPLDMQNQTSGATDLSGNNHDGTYIIPPAYPSGMQAVAQSAVLNPPSVARGTSIIPGDGGGPKNPFPASADFEGGYVSIPWSTQASPQLDQFTFEAWIKPNWTGSGFLWVVFSAFINDTGFRILINDQNHWEIVIGTGPGNMPNAIDTMVSIDPTSPTPTYVAVTCDTSGVFSLWINPLNDNNTPPANWTSGSSTNYVAADPSQLTAIFIGAGANDQPLRTPTMNPMGAPLYPFQGQIQSVALYSSMLDANDLQSHFVAGAG